MPGSVGGAVDPTQSLSVRQRHVTRAKIVHLPQYGEARPDRVATLHPDERGNTPGRHRLLYLIRAQRELHIVGIARDEALRDVDLLDRSLNSFGLRQVCTDINGPPLRPDLPLL